MMRKRMLMAVCVSLVAGPVYLFASERTAALDGNCPVCLVTANEIVKGDPNISSVYDTKIYLFPSLKQKRMFDSNPAAYVPALGGKCVVCKVDEHKWVRGKPEIRAIHNDRVFLFPAEEQKRTFVTNPRKYADVDLALDGNCAVTLVNMNRLAPGNTEWVTICDGLRYMFPTLEKKRTFDAEPTAFVPALRCCDTVTFVEDDKFVKGAAEYHLIHDGRLYLFRSGRELAKFRANPARYANADIAMDGLCAVCKVEMGKDIKGNPEFAVDYHGKRYLFPGPAQQAKFIEDPHKYAVHRKKKDD